MTNAAIPSGRGWYPDPFSKGSLLRMFDGTRWTDQTRPIPPNYDATHAGDSTKPAAEAAADEAAPRANPTDAKSLEGTKAPAKKEAPQGKPAKNGTPPMFSTPTEKAATGPSKGASPAKKDDKSPAFASPTVQSEKPKDPPAQAPADPRPEPPTFNFAKPAQDEPASPPTPAAAPEPAFEKPRPESLSSSSVDAEPEEDSASVNDAFARTPQQQPEFNDAPEDDETDTSSRRPKWQLGASNALRNTKLTTWVATAVLAVTAIAGPTLVPAPIRGVAAECEPLSSVVTSYDKATDFTLTPEAQADIASAVSTGELDEEMTALVTAAVKKKDMKAVVERCLPQEK